MVKRFKILLWFSIYIQTFYQCYFGIEYLEDFCKFFIFFQCWKVDVLMFMKDGSFGSRRVDVFSFKDDGRQ